MVPDNGELSWSDSHSSASDDNSSILLPPSPLWTNPTSTARLETGQLSPISTELEISMVDSSSCTIPTMIHSATSSSCNGSWSGGYSDVPDVEDAEHDVHWEQDSDDVLTVPKVEPMEDDDFHMDDVKEAPRTPRLVSNVPMTCSSKAKRPRGRPRKHPLTPQVSANKVAKGRSKTGCITCRKRKKKCDEAKPRCMNCEKNAVVCEGYNEKTLWKSGKERAEEERQSRQITHITLQPIFQGVETPEDMVFLNHYINHLSGVLTVESQHKNAFKDMLLQMAVEHRGLMHSILALASKHIDYDTPYAMKILGAHPKVTLETLTARSEYHYFESLQKLIDKNTHSEGHRDSPEIVSVRYGQILCLLIASIAVGDTRGQHRVHLQAYKTLIQDSPPEEPAFLVFITEFFQFHIFADELIRNPAQGAPRLATEDWEPSVPIQPARLLGVADGLFKYLTQITSIRNTIRSNKEAQMDPVVDYNCLWRAAEIDAAIREWTPRWPPGDSRERVGLVYQQMMWVYLFRTIRYPIQSSSSSSPGRAFDVFHAFQTAQAGSPPLSPTSPVHSVHDNCNNIDNEHCSSYPESPPPIRYPPHHDPRITIAVDESLAILDSFKPSEPAQTLLLIPCLVIGAACFDRAQQVRIQNAIRAVKGYTGLRNCDRVLELLKEVWRLMERGEWAAVWDWQRVASRMGLDISCC